MWNLKNSENKLGVSDGVFHLKVRPGSRFIYVSESEAKFALHWIKCQTQGFNSFKT